ncbi:MAG TPA: V-type ATP synthase subunit D [candidate division Zixibacteria bacterium]|nr:V-type ATP synthase subunit D [candidate division Zixibacteria bacterium]
MSEGVQATRMNLMKLRERYKLAEKGHDLLQEKLDSLVIRFFEVVDQIRGLREETTKLTINAQKSLIDAQMAVGPLRLKEISFAAPEIWQIEAYENNVAGVVVPKLDLEKIRDESQSRLFYSFLSSSAEIDKTVENYRLAIEKIVVLAETLAMLQILGQAITETKRRVNALRFILVPRLKQNISFIETTLEEQEREQFAQLKKIKEKLEKKANMKQKN